MSITETVLEMHFHKALMDLMRETFHLGPGGDLNFYKWSQQKECFVGFDQAYVKTQLSDDEFFEYLKGRATSNNYSIDDVFFGYFLQFKVVHSMRKRTIYTPPSIAGVPHFRVSLDTTKNKKTGVSQHELLYRLSSNKGAFVYYACPMVFDKVDLYDVNVDLDLLRLADLASCASAYLDSDNHFLFFSDEMATPIWKSEPLEGIAITPLDFTRTLSAKLGRMDARESRDALLDLLTDVAALGISEDAKVFKSDARRDIVRLAEESLTIVQVRKVEVG